MSEDTFLKVRGIVIIMVLLCISLILWRGRWGDMVIWTFWGVCGMFFGGILFGLMGVLRKKKGS